MELIDMKEKLLLAQDILDMTDNFQAFDEKFSENLRFSGEKLIDGATYVFNLGDGYSLVVQFSDYLFKSFSLIHNSLDEILLMQL